MAGRDARLHNLLLQSLRYRVAGRQPVVVRLKLGRHHQLPQRLGPSESVQVQITDLLRSQVAQFALMDAGVGEIQMHRDGELEERVADRLQPLQVDAVVGVGHGERLEEERRTGARVAVQVGLQVEGGRRAGGRGGHDHAACSALWSNVTTTGLSVWTRSSARGRRLRGAVGRRGRGAVGRRGWRESGGCDGGGGD